MTAGGRTVYADPRPVAQLAAETAALHARVDALNVRVKQLAADVEETLAVARLAEVRL